MAAVASTAVSVPANLSGAIRTRMEGILAPAYGGGVTDPTIRPMTEADVPVAERLSAEGFHELDIRSAPRSAPAPEIRSPERGQAWMVRTRHFLSTDPGGCWVAEDADGMVGFVTSYTRELMWLLATYVVRPQAQGRGHRPGPARRGASTTGAAACAGCSPPPPTRRRRVATGRPASRCTRRWRCRAPSTGRRSR